MAEQLVGVMAAGQVAVHPTNSGLGAVWSQLTGFASWFGDSLIHALGNPEEERRFQPPLLGVQPYRDRPYRKGR